MSANSKREQIILTDKALVETVTELKTIQRAMPQKSELDCFAQTQFPVAAVVGRLPIPIEKRQGRSPDTDQIISELKVDIFVYLQVNDNVDTEISYLADSLFGALYLDQQRGKLCIETAIKINEKTNVWAPFAAFQITAVHKYVHGIGGI